MIILWRASWYAWLIYLSIYTGRSDRPIYICMKISPTPLSEIETGCYLICFGRYPVSIQGGPNKFFGIWELPYPKKWGRDATLKLCTRCEKPKNHCGAKIWVGIHYGIEEPFWLRTLCSYKSTTVERPVSNHPKCNKDLVVAYKNRTTGDLFPEVEDNLLHTISKLRSSMLSLKCFVYSK